MVQEYTGEIIKVCPVQGRQLKDVREEDIFEDFRICDTYRGGGGYDQFPYIARKRGLVHRYSKGDISKQFVVQLYGCHLRCPYCYVTRDGILGDAKPYYFGELVEAFHRAYQDYNVGTFHMMGGAPALWMKQWQAVPMHLFPFFLFTSDLLLTEGKYDKQVLYTMNMPNTMYAINIKGVTNLDHQRNTGKSIDWLLFWDNLDKVMEVGLNFYFTFTNPDMDHYPQFVDTIERKYGELVMEDSFIIELKHYEALECGEAW